MRTSIFCAFIGVLLLCSCDSDDGGNSGPIITPDVYRINGDKGSRIKIIYADGTSVEEESSFVSSGWYTGSLLNQNYFKLMRFGTPEGSADIRINVPKDTVFAERASKPFLLNPQLFLLEYSANMGEVYAECFFGFNPDILGGSTGIVKFERNYTHQDSTYHLVGRIEAEFYKNGSLTRMEGTFWNRQFNW